MQSMGQTLSTGGLLIVADAFSAAIGSILVDLASPGGVAGSDLRIAHVTV